MFYYRQNKCYFIKNKIFDFSSEKYNFFTHPRIENADVYELIDLWQNDALAASATCFYNIFEDVIAEENTDVDAIKRLMRNGRALCAMMSGSGPAVFGVFECALNDQHIAIGDGIDITDHPLLQLQDTVALTDLDDGFCAGVGNVLGFAATDQLDVFS